jgi:hypothetical protein
VAGDRPMADEERVGDLLVGEAVRDQLQHFELAR